MKIIAIGDTHGRPKWKQIVAQEKGADKIVFIGDYWDSFNIPFAEQLNNFRDIIQFKNDNTDKVVLIIGNHDFHYMPTASMYGDQYSGYQKKNSFLIGHAIATDKDLFQMAFLHDNHLFTHAGVTQTWLNRTLGLKSTDEVDLGGIPVDEYINQVFKATPQWFLFYEHDRSYFGDSVAQSPIWVRPNSLNEDAYGDYVQIVGHTYQERIGIEPTKFSGNGSGFFIDVLDKTNEYLIIENGNYTVGRISS